MNESEFAVSTGSSRQSRQLRVLRLDRRCLLIGALLIATLRLAATENTSIPVHVARAAHETAVATPLARPNPTLALSPSPTVRLPVLMSESDAWRVTHARHKNASADRWEKFEAEFGITEKEPSLVLGTMQTAKYNLDTILFTVDDFAQNVSDAFQLEYDAGRFRRVPTSGERSGRESSRSLVAVADNARLGLDLNFNGGKPYVGVKLVVPLGN